MEVLMRGVRHKILLLTIKGAKKTKSKSVITRYPRDVY